MNNPLVNRLQELPGLRQLLMLGALAAAIAAGLWLFVWSQKPPLSPLYPALNDRDTAEVADALRGAGMTFQIDPATGAILVPESQVRDARMKLASQGLPQEGRGAMAAMEEAPGFGVTPFVENARYQRALENELASTISGLKPVRSARVHLALPKPSAFARAADAASASVMVELKAGSTLNAEQVAAIVHLVASSIPDLAPERVTVVDQTGHLMETLDPDGPAARSAEQFSQVRRLETAYVQRIQELLEPFTGAGRISAQVSVDMDFSESEEARETYTPDPTKIRSEQLSEETTGTGSSAAPAQGIPGATSNTPPGAAAGTAASSAVASRQSTRNFELDRTLSHTRQPAGRVRRVSAAVLVDHIAAVDAEGKPTDRALTEAEVEQVRALVRDAVGFESERGDTVSVMNAPFARNAEIAEPEATPIWEKPVVREAARLGAGSIAILVLLLGVLRPLLRGLVPPRPQEQTLMPALSAPMQQSAVAFDDKIKLAKNAVTQDPKRVAQLMHGWVGNDG